MDTPKLYETRYFNGRTGDVALTCCHRCGDVVWNIGLHEETHHGHQGTDQEQVNIVERPAGPIADPDKLTQTPTEKPGLGEAGANSGGNTPTSRPVSRPAPTGTGRTATAGQGKQSRR